jgi:drug/metabolite transporter (DMT)-like permease
VDAGTFTAVRLVSGAVVLLVLTRLRGGAVTGGGWPPALALFGYAVAFSWAYLRLPASVGALLLFGAVQVTMLGRALWGGERPSVAEWLGLVVALGGLVMLARPGRTAPDPLGAALMLGAGVGWAIYTLLGRGVPDPLGAIADSFLRSLPLAAVGLLFLLGHLHATGRGILWAALSGSVTSGVGYTIWYTALRGLTATRAALVQLAVPPLAALGGLLLLGEPLSTRTLVSGAIILGGVALAVLGRR